MPKFRFHREPFLAAIPALLLVTVYSCASKGSNTDVVDKGYPAPAPTTGKKTATTGDAATKKPDPAKPIPTAPGTPVHYAFERPKEVKGIYLTAWSAGSNRKMTQMLGLLDRTELNAVVIDIRDTGDMYFKTGIPLADEVHATMVAVAKPDVLLKRLEKHKVWPIARIACFRDSWVPKVHPDRAVNFPNGGVWHDHSKHTWLDPYNKKNWEYIAATVDYALNIGFPEIQLDYVRFPSEGKRATQVFPGRKGYVDPKAKPEDVIAAFAKYIGDKVRARGAVFSADIFGIISSTKGDEGIGQELEKIAQPFDLISPMVYPSHFAKGEYGVKDPNRQPYDILKKSLADFKKRLPDKNVRPWLQDFSLGFHYGPEQVKAELKAARECGYTEFLLWNAGNHYTESALAKEAAPAGAAEDSTPAAKGSEPKGAQKAKA